MTRRKIIEKILLYQPIMSVIGLNDQGLIHIHPRLDIVNLDKLPSWDFIEILCLDSWIYIVNKRSLMGSFTISSLGCILIYN